MVDILEILVHCIGFLLGWQHMYTFLLGNYYIVSCTGMCNVMFVLALIMYYIFSKVISMRLLQDNFSSIVHVKCSVFY